MNLVHRPGGQTGDFLGHPHDVALLIQPQEPLSTWDFLVAGARGAKSACPGSLDAGPRLAFSPMARGSHPGISDGARQVVSLRFRVGRGR
jgi:hypothetical protein